MGRAPKTTTSRLPSTTAISGNISSSTAAVTVTAPLKSVLRVRHPAGSTPCSTGTSSPSSITSCKRRVCIVLEDEQTDSVTSTNLLSLPRDQKKKKNYTINTPKPAAKERRVLSSTFLNKLNDNAADSPLLLQQEHKELSYSNRLPIDENVLPEWLEAGKNYSGFCPFASFCDTETDPIPKIPYSDISPKQFFNDFVLPRRPCILTKSNGNKAKDHTGLLELDSIFSKWKSDDYLRSTVGSSQVDVEVRKGPDSNFGEGCRTKMEFSKVLDHIINGGETYYLTTQTIREVLQGPVKLAGDFLTKTPLVNDYPNVPSILKTLVPSQYNLWFGNASEGTSSGLHHDFHDNFYLTIRGRKTFRLFSPRCAEALQPTKRIQRIHPNGLIAYDDTTRSDGVPESVVFDWRLGQVKAEISVLELRLEVLTRECLFLERMIAKTKLEKKKKKKHLKGSRIGASDELKDIISSGLAKIVSGVNSKYAAGLLEAELKSRQESSKLVKEYISDATDRLTEFENLKADAILRNTIAYEANHITNKQSTDDEDDDEPGFDNILKSMPSVSSEKSESTFLPSLCFLEANMSKEESKELEEKRRVLLKETALNATVDTEQKDDEWNNTDDDESVEDQDTLEAHSNLKPLHFCLSSTIDRSPNTPLILGKFQSIVQEAKKNELNQITNELLKQYIEIVLEPEEMLYLPASWFHEVISCSSNTDVKGHMAFNFWFYPPSCPDATFEEPYVDAYCRQRFRRMCDVMQLESSMSGSFDEMNLMSFLTHNSSVTIADLIEAGLIDSGAADIMHDVDDDDDEDDDEDLSDLENNEDDWQDTSVTHNNELELPNNQMATEIDSHSVTSTLTPSNPVTEIDDDKHDGRNVAASKAVVNAYHRHLQLKNRSPCSFSTGRP